MIDIRKIINILKKSYSDAKIALVYFEKRGKIKNIMRSTKTLKTYSEEFDFFIHNPLSNYAGKYVAIVGKKVISSGDSAKETWDKARKKLPDSLPTIAKIPKKEIMVLVWK